jgi:hypothetical protein
VRLPPLEFGLIKPPADNSHSELMLVDAVDRRIRDGVHPAECLIRIVRHPRRIPQQQDEQDEGMRRLVPHLSSI